MEKERKKGGKLRGSSMWNVESCSLAIIAEERPGKKTKPAPPPASASIHLPCIRPSAGHYCSKKITTSHPNSLPPILPVSTIVILTPQQEFILIVGDNITSPPTRYKIALVQRLGATKMIRYQLGLSLLFVTECFDHHLLRHSPKGEL